ncbi:TPA: LPXTG cell wall anchor domain-containing protein, partial [Streptococcus suis]
ETFVFDLAADDDNDGYSNQEELIAGSDYQNDRSKPEAMISQNLSLVNQGPANFFDLSGDPDGDGFTNEEELVAGTDYQDPTDYPKTSTLDEAQAEDGEISSFLLNAQDSLVSSRVQKADQARADSPAKEKPNLVNPETSDHLSSNQEGLKSGSQEGDSPVGASQTSKTYANAGLRLPDTGEETLSLIFGPAAMAILGSLGLIAKRKENEA